MFCDVAYATPIENLIVGVIITIIGFVVVNLFNIDPLFLFSIVYGVIFIFNATLLICIIFFSLGPYKTLSKKNKKQELLTHFVEMSFFYILFILVLGGLLIFR